MQPILIVALASVAGAPLGLWLRHNLAALGYRRDDERDLPQPGPRWWVVWATMLALGSLAGAASVSSQPVSYLTLLPLLLSGPWLAAVDIDVLRLPNGVLATTTIAVLLAIAGIAVAGRDWRTIIVPVAAALVTAVVFAAVHFATKGGIGFGDVKLAALISLALGSAGISAVWLSPLVGSLAALGWSVATHKKGAIPYGPWMLAGAILAAVFLGPGS